MSCILLAASVATAAGCTSLAERIAVPRSTTFLAPDQQIAFERHMGVSRHATTVAPGVTLAWRLVPPADRAFEVEYTRTDDGAAFTVGSGKDHVAQPLAARGTVVYLHGWNMDSTLMLPWALALADHGYRGIAVDLRGHGESSDAPAGYGGREARDIAALLESLDDTAQLAGPVYLLGVSYGAATALLAEPIVRDRIAGIVALAPYSNAADGIRGAVGEILDNRGGSLPSRLLFATMRLRYGGEGDIDRAIEEAAAMLDLDIASIDVVDAVAGSATCTLLLHGAEDELVPVDASRTLAASSALVRYRELPEENHLSLPMRIDLLGDPVAAWLDAVGGGGCPALDRNNPSHA